MIIALQILGSTKFKGQYFWIHVDNEAVSTVINTGAARVPALQEALKEIALLAAEHQFIIKARHITGVSNRIPDWLSRWHEQESKKLFNQYAKDKSLYKCKVPSALQLENNW